MNLLIKKNFFPLCLLIFLLSTHCTIGNKEATFVLNNEKPNIVVILADDLGYGDIQALNKDSKIPTPHLNQFAKEGMRFVDAHTSSSVCTPTRYGLLTGRYAWRSVLKKGVLSGRSSHLIRNDQVTLASFLKEKGYQTACIGKWHLGMDFHLKDQELLKKNQIIRKKKFKVFKNYPMNILDFSKPIKNGPNKKGFDYYYGISASLDMPPYAYIENDLVTELPTQTNKRTKFPPFMRSGPKAPNFSAIDCLDKIVEKSTDYIKKTTSKNPFFLYVPLTSPHKPVLVHKRFQNKTKLGPYGDFIHQTDWSIGQIIKAIDNKGIKKNTIVFITSDNGSYMYRLGKKAPKDHLSDSKIGKYKENHHRANHVFRGTKADIWEGGHRVPFFVRWPSKIKGNSQSKKIVSLVDIFNTCAALLGEKKMKKGTSEDSYSFLSTLIKQKEEKRPPIITHSSKGMFSIRDNHWKLVLGNGSGGREKPRGIPFKQPYQLFDLSKDIKEETNLIESNPKVASTLIKKFKKIKK